METKKCPKCNLVNWSTNKACKRCNSHLDSQTPIKNNSNNTFSNEWTNQVITRKQELIFGFSALFAGIFLLGMNWLSASNSGKFYAGSTILAPVTIAIGLCLIVFPFPEKEHFPKAEYAPKGWAIFLIPAFIIGALNWAYFMGII
jgi:RNA polymerase subunit RPABC4/transcription elongation factor Spt4